ncbi:MAG: methyltransferase domain-containing protein [Pseudomonadota bacterium]
MGEPVIKGAHGRFHVDERRRPDSLLIDEIILQELVRFLEENFEKGRGGRLLDAGAGSRPYLPVYKEFFTSTVSIDMPGSPHDIAGLDVAGTLHSLPFRDGEFDCVLCTEVFEHLHDPLLAMKECSRVLKRGGRLFMSTPFFNPLHEIPHDYYRYTPFAIKHIAACSGLRTLSIDEKGGEGAFALMYITYLWLRLWLKLLARLGKTSSFSGSLLTYLTIVLPQKVYLGLWKKRLRQRYAGSCDKPFTEKFSMITLGYTAVLEKNAAPTLAEMERL